MTNKQDEGQRCGSEHFKAVLAASQVADIGNQARINTGTFRFMNWTSTEHHGWAEECLKFASERKPFRLDHVFGPKEEKVCDTFCAEHTFRQKKCGSSVLFTPIP